MPKSILDPLASIAKFGFFVVILLFGTGLKESYAVTITDNTAEAQLGTIAVTATTFRAMQFTTDATGYTLNFVTLPMGVVADASGNFQVDIYSDVAGAPGVLLETLSGSATPPALSSVTYTSVVGLVLAASTPYWVVLGVSAGAGDYRWNVTGSFNQVGPGSIGDGSLTSINNGATWSFPSPNPGRFLVDGTISSAIPVLSPFGLAILGVGLASFGGCRLRRRKKTTPRSESRIRY